MKAINHHINSKPLAQQIAPAEAQLAYLKSITQTSGLKKAGSFNKELDAKMGAIKNAFPGNTFPLASIHEFISITPEDAATTSGFLSVIIASLMQTGGATIWIGNNRSVFLPALQSFGISPEKIIFIDLKKEKEILWAMEEALKCKAVAAVIGQIPELNFTASRRLQLAVEQSRVTGFVLRQNPRSLNITACVTRWKITSLSSEFDNEMPGVGFPRWNVALLKVRNGKPGEWQVENLPGGLKHIYKIQPVPQQQKKAG